MYSYMSVYNYIYYEALDVLMLAIEKSGHAAKVYYTIIYYTILYYTII